jgi:hypothetical protein
MGEAHNLTAISESIVYAVRVSQHLRTLYTSKGCYRGNFSFYTFSIAVMCESLKRCLVLSQKVSRDDISPLSQILPRILPSSGI